MPHVKLPSGTSLFYQYHRGGQVVHDLSLERSTVILLHPQFASSEVGLIVPTSVA